jgi:hypothetical protein
LSTAYNRSPSSRREGTGFGDNRKNTLHDMSVVAVALVFGDKATLVKIEDTQIHDLGQVDVVTITKDDSLQSTSTSNVPV